MGGELRRHLSRVLRIDRWGDKVEGVFSLVMWNVAPADYVREAFAAMSGGPVAMTSVTRPSNATPPVSEPSDRPPAKPRR